MDLADRSISIVSAALISVCLTLTALAVTPDVDPGIEKRLDDYLQQFDRDPDELYALLVDIADDLQENTPINTRVRVKGYVALAEMFRQKNELAFELIDELIDEAEASSSRQALAESLAFQIEALVRTGDSTNALVIVPRLQPLLTPDVSPRVRYYAHNLLARLLRSSGQHEQSLENFLAAYDAVQETDDERTEIRRQFLNVSIAQLQADLRHFEPALNMTNRAIAQAETMTDRSSVPELLLLRGYLEGSLEMHEESLETYRQAIALAREMNQPDIVLISMNNIGSTLIQLERYQEAEDMLEAALEEAIEQDDDITTQLLHFNLGYVAIMQGEHEDGIARVEAATEELRKDYSQSELADLLKYLAEARQGAGRLDQAIDALLEQRELNESLFQAEREQSLNELQIQYEAREQATQIQLLEQRNALQQRMLENQALQRRIAVLFALVVLMAMVLLWLAFRAARKANLRLKAANRQLKYQSSHDPLTGLLNRRLFQQRMAERAKRVDRQRNPDHPDAIILLDVDYFKKINDQYGHATGDTVLVELARRLKSICRSSDMAVRWGGEEILMYLQNMDPASLPDYARKVLETIGSEPVVHEGRTIPVTATGGFITLPFAGLDEQDIGWEKALQIADLALYMGKTHGRNQALGVLGLTVPLETASPALEQDLATAIERGWVDSITIPGPQQRG